MNLDDYRLLFIAITFMLILVGTSPVIGYFVTFSSRERLSELWILGPNHMAQDYPFNIRANKTYKIFAGISNYMAVSSYYLVYVKFRNLTDPLPDIKAQTPSPLNALYEYRTFIQDSETWESPLTFSFAFENPNLVKTLTINNVTFWVNKSDLWDPNYRGYYYQLFIELWIYDAESDSFQFHNRFVSLMLNMTQAF